MFKHSIQSGFSFFDNELSGQAIVFVHGLGANAQYADFLVKAFPSSRLILTELPGHGRAPDPVEPVDIALFAQELILALQYKGIEKPIMCGHSLGGQICLLSEIVHPEYASKLILIAPAGLESFTKTEIQVVLTSLNITAMFQSMNAPAYTSSFLKEERRTLNNKAISAYISSMLNRPVNDMLHMIKCEVQVYFGEHDMLIPNRMFRMETAISYAKRIIKDLPNFSLHHLENSGHWPMLENANGLIKILRQNNLELK